jgi:dipicolinate synthase subunit B
LDCAGLNIGFALCGSFCTLERVLPQVEKLVESGANVLPIVSEAVKSTDTRFGKAAYFLNRLKAATNNELIDTIAKAEPIGPKNLLDALIIAPCTGNTLGKLANGVTDSTVTMAAKATLRNEKPVILAISTNDGLGTSAKNIGTLLNAKNYYFVPFGQDNPQGKHNSLIADMDQIISTLCAALENKQKQPILL